MRTATRFSFLLLIMTVFIAQPRAQVVINEISPFTGQVELKNLGDSEVDISSYQLCNFPDYQPVDTLTTTCGALMLGAGEVITFDVSLNLNSIDGEMGLYLNTDWMNPSSIIDYVEWGSTGHQRASVAQTAGIWDGSMAVMGFATSASLEYSGDGDAVTSWDEATVPSICAENSNVVTANADTVRLATDPTLGQILTDGDGFTLYYFTRDASPNASACDGPCEDAWPIYHASDLSIGTGLDAADFGEFQRQDGQLQTTYKGWPLYYWFQDTTAGMTAGEAVGGVWFVAKPDYSIMLIDDQLTGQDGVNYGPDYTPADTTIQYFVDAYGRTIYIFINDNFNQNNFSIDSIFDDRNAVWPIYEETMGAFASTLDESLFDVIEVSGRNQLTYNGWPLYYWMNDMERGDNLGVSVPDPGVWPVAVAGLEEAPEVVCEAAGGSISLMDGTTETTICAGDSVSDALEVTLVDAAGSNSQWVVTDADGNILALPPSNVIDLEGAGAGLCLIWHLSFEDGLTGAMVGNNAADLEGCFDLSNPISVYRVADEGCDQIGSAASVVLSDDADLGQILVDGDGFTLYYFTRDASPNTSACDGGCEDAWPIFYGEDLSIGTGLDAADFGQFVREDGQLQTTYKGWPLYYWFQDTTAGMTAGEAVGGVWFVAKPDYSIMLIDDQLTGQDGVNYGPDYTPADTTIQYFVDAYGRTIYIFINDNFNQNNFSIDSIFDDRNMIWPIYEETMGAFASTLDESLFDVIEVSGRNQLTYNGWPLYYWMNDMERGDNLGVSVPEPGIWPVAVAGLERAPDPCNAAGGSISLMDGTTETTICAGDSVSDALEVTLVDAAGSNSQWVVTDADGNILALPPSNVIDLEGAGPGLCLIWHLSFEDGLTGAMVGNNAADLEGCFDLSNPISVYRVADEGCDQIGSEASVVLSDDADLGQILVDGDGFTLYYFTRDASPNTSACDGGCEDAWPIFYGEDLSIGTGLDAADFGQFVREDGQLQTTYKGWPLYYWFQDTTAGMTAGEAVGGVWFVAKPDYSIMLIDDQLTGQDGVNYGPDYTPADTTIQYFVDAYGRTIYIFINDNFNQNNFSIDSIFDDRNAVWPIYEETMGAFASTLDESLFDVIEVSGRNQLTYNGWPLYYWMNDMERGDNLGVSVPEPGIWPVAVAGLDRAPDPCNAAGGSISLLGGSTETTICVDDSVSDALEVMLVDAVGSNSQWVVTDTAGNILALPPSNVIDLEGTGAGICLIWHLSFEDGLTGAMVGNNAADLEGCFSLSNPITVTRVVGEDCVSSNENTELNQSFAVYPNPVTSESFVVNYAGLGEDAMISVFSSVGALQHQQQVSAGSQTVEIDASSMANGLYIINMHNATMSRTQKVLIQR